MKSKLLNGRPPRRRSLRLGWLLVSSLGLACAGSSGVREAPPPAPASASPGVVRAPASIAMTTATAAASPGASTNSAVTFGSAAPETHTAEDTSAAPDLEIEAPFWPEYPARPPGEVNAAVVDEEVARWNVGGRSDPDYRSNQAKFHPGTRVLVDAKATPRRLERAVLARARAAGYWPFRLCFERGGTGGGLAEGGRSVLSVRLAPRGRVVSTRLVRTELKDRAVARCLAERARGLVFTPVPGRRVDVELTVGLWPGDAALPRRALPRTGEAAPSPEPLSSLRPHLDALRPAVARCYAAGLTRDPGLWGRLQLRLDPDASGHVAKATEDESRFPDAEVVRCVLHALHEVDMALPPASVEVAFRLGRPPAPDPQLPHPRNPEGGENTAHRPLEPLSDDPTGHTEPTGADKNSSLGEPK